MKRPKDLQAENENGILSPSTRNDGRTKRTGLTANPVILSLSSVLLLRWAAGDQRSTASIARLRLSRIAARREKLRLGL